MRSGPRSFVGGEVSDRLFGRPDDPRYNHGAEILQNAIVTATGVAQKRPGTRFVRESRNSAEFRLITYRTSVFDDVWVEFGLRTEYPASSSVATYLRFHTQGSTVLHSTVWSATTAYAVGALVTHPTASGTLSRCKVAHTNQPPPDATYWESLAYDAGDDYAEGDLVSYSGRVYYCRVAHTSASPHTPGVGETYWYAMPLSGEYEIPTAMLHPSKFALFANLTHSQQGSVLTLASTLGRPQEISLSGTTWFCRSTVLAPNLPPPTGVSAVATRPGSSLAINYVFSAAGGTYAGKATINCTIVSGVSMVASGVDFVYVSGTAFPAINDKVWRTDAVAGANIVLVDPATGLGIAGPGSPTAAGGTARVVSGSFSDEDSYVVTAIDDTGRESAASSAATVGNNLSVSIALNTVSWSAVTDAVRYNVYKKQEGTSLYGFIGQTSGTSFQDGSPGIAPSLDRPPPILDASLDNQGPLAVTHFEGRRWFANPGVALSQDVWGTKTNTESDLSYAIPLRDTDRIRQRIKGRYGCSIRHMVPMSELIVLTDTTEFRVTSPNGDALTPESFVARPQSYHGAGFAQPEIMGSVVLFSEARGGNILQMGYANEAGGYLTASICERATHLFDGQVNYQLSAQRAPVPVLWVSQQSRSLLLGCTFIPSQQVLAWHRHVTDGLIETVMAGLDSSADRVYLGVARTINGATKRFVERMEGMQSVALEDGWFVDCGLRYDGAATAAITGLDHLEGKEVAVLADGLVQARKTVAAGSITLDSPASKVTVGLPYRMLAKTPPPTFAIEALGSGNRKSPTKVWLRVNQSGAWSAGNSEDDLLPAETTAGELYTGQQEVRVPGGWTDDAPLLIVSDDPTPLNVVSYTAQVEVA